MDDDEDEADEEAGVAWAVDGWLVTDDSARRLLGRRYRSGVDFDGDAATGGARLPPEVDVITVDSGRAVPDATRAVPMMAVSSLDPDFWLNEDKSEEPDEVVDTEAAAGYRDRGVLVLASGC